MVNDLMAAAVFENVEGGDYFPYRVAEQVINSAWTKLDLDDESTWPESGTGKFYYVHFNDGGGAYWHFYGIKDGWQSVKYYANPADLEPVNKLLHVSEVENAD